MKTEGITLLNIICLMLQGKLSIFSLQFYSDLLDVVYVISSSDSVEHDRNNIKE